MVFQAVACVLLFGVNWVGRQVHHNFLITVLAEIFFILVTQGHEIVSVIV